MIRLIGPINSGAAVGANGVATANADSSNVIRGIVRAIHVKYNDSPPAGTTDVVIKTKGTDAPSLTLLTITNSATDAWKMVKHAVQSNLGADIANEYDFPAIHDLVNVKIDQANAGDNIDVFLLVEG